MYFFVSYSQIRPHMVRFMLDRSLCRVHAFESRHVFKVERVYPRGRLIRWTHLAGQMVLRLPSWSMDISTATEKALASSWNAQSHTRLQSITTTSWLTHKNKRD